MAHSDATGGPGVALDIPTDDIDFLRRIFTMAQDGIQDELERYPDQLREPTRLRREEAVYEKLLAALATYWIVPDRDVCDVLTDLALMIDRENEYRRVVAEHAALLGLRGQVGSEVT